MTPVLSDPSLYIAGAALTIFGLVLFLPDLIDRYRIRRAQKDLRAGLLGHLREELAWWMARCETYERLYHDAVKMNAALLEHIGDEREAVAQTLADSPLFFDTAAQQTLAWLDTETGWTE